MDHRGWSCRRIEGLETQSAWGQPPPGRVPVDDELSRTDRFCDSRRSPAMSHPKGVQNPCPKSTSQNHRCQRVLRRSVAWDICLAMPASRPPTSNPSCRSTPSNAPAAIGCSPRPPAAPAATAPSSSRPGPAAPRRHPGRLETRPPRPLPAPPGRTVTGLAERGVGFRSLQEAIDTTTPGGKLVFHVFAALAEFERDLIRERTSAGLAAARARGRHGGRPSVMTAHKTRVAQEMYRSGQYTLSAIANTLGVSRASIYRHLTRPDRRFG